MSINVIRDGEVISYPLDEEHVPQILEDHIVRIYGPGYVDPISDFIKTDIKLNEQAGLGPSYIAQELELGIVDGDGSKIARALEFLVAVTELNQKINQT